MRSIARSLELSLASNAFTPEYAALRRADLYSLNNPIAKRVGLGLDTFAAKHRRVAEMTLRGISTAVCGMRYVGNGATASVYRDKTMVVKVYRQTVPMAMQEKQDYLDKRQAYHKLLATNLGALVTPQAFSIGTHPLGDYTAVLGRQPYIDGRTLNLFRVNTSILNYDDIYAYCERQPGGQTELLGLSEGTFQSSDHDGVVPDLNGEDNFRLVGPSENLILIDSDPIARGEHPKVHDHVLKQAEALGQFLSAA